MEILTDQRYRDVIRWSTNNGSYYGTFRLIDQHQVARLWGARKNNLKMDYQKFSRALRYYKGGGMLEKVDGQAFTHQFVCNLKQVTGMDPDELANMANGPPIVPRPWWRHSNNHYFRN